MVLIFLNWKILFFFSKKNLAVKVEKTFFRNNIILYAFYSNFSTFTDLKKTQILYVLRNLSISVAFYGNFAIFW